ncbi:uncharacterized protein LOC110688928 [Chenopodium quinoa]|uniref:uncharacterized protein LOC110688928 n=1 Tax=Chenopodium quinoa TaxID=63459 RepID=UPI000B773CD0|nr:uncharacterized protein LOC110688928 [Chenopodium quinoa]
MGSYSNVELNEDPNNPIDKRKVIGYKTKTVSEPVYEDEVNMQMEASNEISSTNPNIIYIPIDACIEDYNKYKFCAYIDSGSSTCFGKRSLFPEFLWKKAKNPMQVRIANNSVMMHTEIIEDLKIKIGGVQCVIPILWATDQPSHDMIIENNFQSQRGDRVTPTQQEVALRISECESSLIDQINKQQEKLCEKLYSTNPLEHWEKDKAFAKITLTNPNKIIRVRQMVYTYQDILEFDEQIKELLNKNLIRNSKSPHNSPAFMVRNHAEEKRGKARMVINYKQLNDNTVFDG